MNENSIYLNTSTDPIKIPDYLSSIGLDATEVLDMSAMSDQYRSECGEQATRNQCQKEEYIMYGEYFEWVPEWMKVLGGSGKLYVIDTKLTFP